MKNLKSTFLKKSYIDFFVLLDLSCPDMYLKSLEKPYSQEIFPIQDTVQDMFEEHVLGRMECNRLGFTLLYSSLFTCSA